MNTRTSTHSALRLFALAVAGLVLCTAPVLSAERAMIVLDASGSMWGRIDQKPKIGIARSVLKEVLADLPSEVELGLIAYGHRRKGQCDDIELLVEPGAGSAVEIGAVAEGLNPLGKTPLSASVKLAAETLKFTEDKATVVLITDGIETCNADPCALGRELEATGVDFTAHVVGFGLSAEEGRQVACLAEETGGLYLPAHDAGQLGEALDQPLTEIAEAEIARDDPASEAEATPAPAELPAATLDAPNGIEIGRPLTIVWDGPGERRDAIEIFDPAARNGEGRVVASRRLISGDVDARSVALLAPVRPGDYEIRYWWGEGRTVLTTRPLEVVEAPVSLDAPASVGLSKTFTVAWVGPGARRDAIRIVDPRKPDGSSAVLRSRRLVSGDFDGRTVALVAPAEPGFYQLHYFSGDGRAVLATREIEVLDADVALEAPDEVAIATRFTVTWTGPGARRDAVEIFDPLAGGGAGKVVESRRVVSGDMDARTVDLHAPAKPGGYELRYYNGENRTVLATRALAVLEADVTLAAPETVAMGRRFSVEWTGPGARRDAIQLFDPRARAGEGKVLASTRLVSGDMDERIVALNAPATAGDYELRYYNGDNSAVLATRAISVEEIAVGLEAPDTALIGHTVEIKWEGPGARRDAIQLFDPNAKAGQGAVETSQRIVSGDMDAQLVRLVVPAIAGDYVVRYFSGEGRKVLAERPIVVEAMEVALDAPASVPAAQFFKVAWVGPGAARDAVELFDPEANAGKGKVLASARVVNGDYDGKSVMIKAPAEPGAYRLRYHNGHSRVVLHETGVVVE
ncbi:VWA domain-containing protein [Nitratireductor sp. CAU 1489]|uniref:VWA domain-containing protein n=1 Tax=Nitratireductor arenosus TaxID=2682096 RepID=A0A844QCM7_9HYPH|nr:VWA domain-containing protein [Nitratireductor arenosus]